MGLYRKKPVVIEAEQFTKPENYEYSKTKVCGFLVLEDINGDYFMLIPTLEGTHKASVGDWIVKGIVGEFYPVKDSIFKATYELVIQE